MGYFEERKRKKFDKLAKSSSQIPVSEEAEKEIRRLKRISDTRRRDLKKLIPTVLGTALGLFFVHGLLTEVVSNQMSLIISSATLVGAYLTIWFFTVKTYIPPGMDFFLTGHVIPGDKDSMLAILDIHAPMESISDMKTAGQIFPVLRPYGISSWVEEYDYDEETGDLYIKPLHPARLNEFNYTQEHQIFHELKETNTLLLTLVNKYRVYVPIAITVKAREMAEELSSQITISQTDIFQGKKVLGGIETEISSLEKELKVKLQGSDEVTPTPGSEEQ